MIKISLTVAANTYINVICTSRCQHLPPSQPSRCVPRRPPQPRTRVQKWQSCSVTMMFVRHPTISRSNTLTCTFVMTSMLRTKVIESTFISYYFATLPSCFSVSDCPAINERITGGAMQLSFSSITLDYYPFHKAGNDCILLIYVSQL